MRHLNKTKIADLLEELGIKMDSCQNSRINVPKDNPYDRPMLEIILERQERFGKRMEPNYRTIEEQEE